jgi:hypothetical protein
VADGGGRRTGDSGAGGAGTIESAYAAADEGGTVNGPARQFVEDPSQRVSDIVPEAACRLYATTYLVVGHLLPQLLLTTT